MKGAARRVESKPKGGPTGGPCLEIESTGRVVTVGQEVAAAANSEYFFSGWVKADDRVWAQVGSAKLSYYDTGRWQRLAGMVRTGPTPSVRIRLVLASVREGPCTYRLAEMALRPADEPALPRRKRRDPTRLIEGGQPLAFVVYPSERPRYRELAEQVRRGVVECTGVELPLVDDAEATEAEHPLIRETHRDSHLILLGRLGVNRAMWPAYNRFLCASDGHYPGGKGYVVRTASNVLRNNRDHVILGGSTEEGVARAVERFVALLRELESDEKGTLTLPWLLEVELEGSCLEQLRAEDERWTQSPDHPRLPKVEPSYGTVLRWQRNAMAYYWTGWDRFRRRAEEHLDQILADDAVMGHYVAEFFVRVYSMFDGAGVIDDAQTARVDAYILKCFREWWFENAGWRPFTAPPYEHTEIMNRHLVAPVMADLTVVAFLHERFELTGDLRDLVEYRRGQWHGLMGHLARNRWQVSLPGAPTTEHTEEFAASLFRYALDHDDYGLFETGNAVRALDLDRINHRTGRLTRPAGPTDHHLLLGILAHYYRDGRYLALLEQVPNVVHRAGHFMGRYICGVRRYTPGPELQPTDPDSLAGVSVPAMMPHHRLFIQRLAGNHYLRPAVDPDEALDLAVFRSGFDAADDYVAVSGIASVYPPGVFLTFTLAGTDWFGATIGKRFGPTSDRYFDQNALSVVRTDRWIKEKRTHTAAARLDWSADLQHAGVVAFTLEPFGGARWQREVIRVQPRLYVVRDIATALEEGQYELSINLLPIGLPSWNGRTWRSATDKGQLHVTPLGKRFTVRQNAEAARANPDVAPEFRQTASVRLAKGESITAVAVYQAASSSAPIYEARLVESSQLHLGEQNGAGVRLLFGPVESDGLQSDAKLLVVDSGRIRAFQATRLRVDGQTLVDCADPVDRTIDRPRLATHVAQTLASRTSPEPTTAAQDSCQPLEATDRSGRWQVAWQYGGLKRPTRVGSVRAVEPDIVDLGKVVRLAQVRAITDVPKWEPARLPSQIWTALPDEAGRVPPADSDAWRKLPGEPQWRPSIQSGNYGGCDRVEQAFQVVDVNGVQARYVRAENASQLVYFDADTTRATQPIHVDVVDVNGDGRKEMVAKPHVWRRFVREEPRQLTDESWAVLNADGRALCQCDEAMNIQEVKVLDYDGSGAKHIAVLTVDAQVRLYRPDGTLAHHFDLYEMQRQFNETEGRPNTRHPAGGLLMPYSMGLWRQASTGARKLVVARYGWASFIDEKGQFEGVLALGGYVAAPMMDYGIDFDGDGRDEILTLACTGVAHIFGDLDRRVPDPKGYYFYPQIHHHQWCRAPAGDGTIDGPPPLAFEPVVFGAVERTRYVVVARTPFLAIYDGLKRKWAFTWGPPVTLRAVAVTEDSEAELAVLAATADGLVYRLTWRDGLAEPASFCARMVEASVRRIVRWPHEPDTVLLAADQGVYLLRGDDELELLKPGSYSDAQPLSEGGISTAVIAVTSDGVVERLSRRAK